LQAGIRQMDNLKPMSLAPGGGIDVDAPAAAVVDQQQLFQQQQQQQQQQQPQQQGRFPAVSHHYLEASIK